MSGIEVEPGSGFSGIVCRVCEITASVSRRLVKEQSSEKENRANILSCCNAAAAMLKTRLVRNESQAIRPTRPRRNTKIEPLEAEPPTLAAPPRPFQEAFRDPLSSKAC
jgi:hypothetical protein